jgi:CRISPR/Cas system-associated endoribonuclease Cas2
MAYQNCIVGEKAFLEEQERADCARQVLPTYVHRVQLSCYDLRGLRNSCKISFQEAEKIERLQESIFMNFKFGRSSSNFSSQ